MRRRQVVFSIAVLLALLPAAARAEDAFTGRFAGHYGGERIELEIELIGAGRYEGALRRGDEILLLQARRFGDRLVGRVGNETAGVAVLVEARGMGIALQIGEDAPFFLRRR